MTIICVDDLSLFKLCPASELSLELCLNSGQTFTWTLIQGYWINCFSNQLFVLYQAGDHIIFKCRPDEEAIQRAFLTKYFRLQYNLSDLYKEWSGRDPFFARAASKYQAIRLLDQPPLESLLSFICSQNNGISRITSMVRTLKREYGKPVQFIANGEDGLEGPGVIYEFPHVQALCFPTIDSELRHHGFGYRALYIKLAAEQVFNGSLKLEELRDSDYETTWKRLLNIKGVGPKVADCVALTGLGHMEAVPIDTHLWAIARTHYSGMPKAGSLTLKVYQQISCQFRKIFGPLAGWAHLVLFAAQIRQERRPKAKAI